MLKSNIATRHKLLAHITGWYEGTETMHLQSGARGDTFAIATQVCPEYVK